jgi:hypothetical protein
MKNNVTVKQALQKGRIKLVFLPLAIILVCVLVSVYLKKVEMMDNWVVIVGGIIGFLLAWLAWSYLVVGWKIWAYENVRNVNELKRKAIEQNLIWKDGSWFGRTEIINYEQKQKLKQLEKKFLEKDVYKDDLNVPKETLVFYSKSNLAFELVISLFLIASGGYLYYSDKPIWLALIMIAIGGYSLYSWYKKINEKSPQIILNEQGITLKESGFFSWDDIDNDRVYTKSSGKTSTTCLAFNYEEVEIDGLDIDAEDVENLLHVYRVRFERGHSN